MINDVLFLTLKVKHYTGHRVQSMVQFDIIDNINTMWLIGNTYRNIVALDHKHKGFGMKVLRVRWNIFTSRAGVSLV